MDEKAIVLLEEIAWRLHGGLLEKEAYLKRLYGETGITPKKQNDQKQQGVLKQSWMKKTTT